MRALFAAVGAALTLALAASAAAAPYPSVSGPLWVTIGKPLTLRVQDFPPNRRLTVELWLASSSVGAHPCCTSVPRTSVTTDASGRAVIRFRWPRMWKQHPRGSGRWRPYDVVIVMVFSAGWEKLHDVDQGRATKVVFVSA